MEQTTQQTAFDISVLTPEQKATLLKELEESQRMAEKKKREDRANYKSMVDNEIKLLFPVLEQVSQSLSAAKKYVFDNLEALIKLKAELYGREEDQYRHSFTTTDGLFTIHIGRNVNDGWDDTVNTGIAKVNDFLKTFAKDAESESLVNTILRLLSKDTKGNLKASRVLELKKLADDVGNKAFQDAIQIIQDAYRPTPTKEFIRCEYKDKNGASIILPLSITEAAMLAE